MNQQLTALTIPYQVIGKDELLKVNFETAVAESIDEGLSAFGNTIKQAIYSQLENKYSIRKEEIHFKIEAFTNAIEFTFGQGAKLIEIKIVKKLHGKIKGFVYKTEKRELFFAEYMAALQSYLESQA